MRRTGFKNTIKTGKTERKRCKGRLRENILDGMARWLVRKPNELIGHTNDRCQWSAMIAHADLHGTR
jgi:hypothetical protein